MLSGHDIIYFSNDWNADNKTSSHHIARQLSRFNRLLYVEASGLRAPRASSHDIKRFTQKMVKFIRGARKVNNQVYVFSPFLLPFHQFSLVKWINELILIYSLKKVCNKIGFKKPILWVIIPHMSVVVGNLDEKLLIYYCVDDFSSLPGVSSEAVAQLDRELSRRADIIFTPSIPLYEKKKKINDNTFLSPHGVDFAHFSKAVNNHLPVPEDIKTIKKPLIGFFGLIENWIDLDLVKYIAKNKPEWSIVMIGRVVKDISAFKNISNVYFLGPRPYGLLPNYAKVFDVAIIPYVLNNQVYNANPIKLREYLAAGKPVVTVRTPEIEKFSEVVKISDIYDEFVQNIEVALEETSDEHIKQRLKMVKDSSWENHFERISTIVSSILNQKADVDIHNDKRKNYISEYGIANDIYATVERQLKMSDEKLKNTPSFLKEIISTYPKESKVLDVGCGVGSDLRVLHENGFNNLYGVDIVFEAVVQAQKLNSKGICQANCEKLPFKSNSFDICIAHNIIEHILDPLKFLNEVKRVLKPNKVVYLTSPRAASLDDCILRWGGIILHGRSSHIQKFNLTKLYGLFQKSNLEVAECKEKRGAEVDFPTLNKVPGFFIIANALRWIFKTELTGWDFKLKNKKIASR